MRTTLLAALFCASAVNACGPSVNVLDEDLEPGLCDAYDDESTSGSLTVVVRNESDVTVYLPTDCGAPRFAVVDSAGEGWRSTFDCVQTCEDRQTEEQMYCGGCLETVGVVPPGESIELVWTGTALRTTEMEAACWLNDEGGSCEREIAAPAGSYEVSVTGYAGCTGECACAASGGDCEGSVDGVSAVASAFDVSWPDAATVEVVFPLCAFGCAGG